MTDLISDLLFSCKLKEPENTHSLVCSGCCNSCVTSFDLSDEKQYSDTVIKNISISLTVLQPEALTIVTVSVGSSIMLMERNEKRSNDDETLSSWFFISYFLSFATTFTN